MTSQREPSVRQDARGTWVAQVDLGRDSEGRRVRPQRSFPAARDRAEAEELAAVWARNLTADGRVRSLRVGELLDDYVRDRSLTGVSPNTVRRWRLFCRYVARYLPNRPVGDITALDLSRFEHDLLRGKADGGQGLCPNSVVSVHNFLSCAWDRWVATGLAEENPMRSVMKPREQHHDARSLNEWNFGPVARELDRVMAEADPEDHSSMVSARDAFGAWVALHTGMRCGEVCALRVADVSFSRRELRVRGNVTEATGRADRSDQTKGRRSRNVAVTDADLDVVRGWFRLIAACREELADEDALVSVDGSFTRPTTLSNGFRRIKNRLTSESPSLERGLRGITFHSLRHTHASMLLANGMDVKTVSERLGHANVSTTLSIYAHVMPGRDRVAAVSLADVEREMRASEPGRGWQTDGRREGGPAGGRAQV